MIDFKMPLGFQGRPDNWTSETETYRSSGGLLFEVLHHQEPWTSPKALFIIHGFGEHSGRFLHFTHHLKDQVQSVMSYDQRGHGRSEGLRGHIQNFDDLVDDAEVLLRKFDQTLVNKFGKSEIHLFAHSMGGHVGIRLLGSKKNLPLKSATISAPMLGVAKPVPALKKYAAKALFHLWGELQLPTGLDASMISRDPEAVKFYKNDRLVHSKMTSKMWNSIVVAMEDTPKRIREVGVPVFFIVPMKDGLVSAQKSIDFYKTLKAPVKDILTLPEYFHESFNDLQKEKVFEAISKWIQKNA